MGEQAVTEAGTKPDSGQAPPGAAGATPPPEATTAAAGTDAAPASPAGDATSPGPAGDVTAAPPGGTAAAQSRTSDIVPGPGGVMTDEVGVVTGELTLRTEFAAGQVTLRVQYKDAEEWYAVTGGRAALPDASALDAVHGIAVGLLNRPEG